MVEAVNWLVYQMEYNVGPGVVALLAILIYRRIPDLGIARVNRRKKE